MNKKQLFLAAISLLIIPTAIGCSGNSSSNSSDAQEESQNVVRTLSDAPEESRNVVRTLSECQENQSADTQASCIEIVENRDIEPSLR